MHHGNTFIEKSGKGLFLDSLCAILWIAINPTTANDFPMNWHMKLNDFNKSVVFMLPPWVMLYRTLFQTMCAMPRRRQTHCHKSICEKCCNHMHGLRSWMHFIVNSLRVRLLRRE